MGGDWKALMGSPLVHLPRKHAGVNNSASWHSLRTGAGIATLSPTLPFPSHMDCRNTYMYQMMNFCCCIFLNICVSCISLSWQLEFYCAALIRWSVVSHSINPDIDVGQVEGAFVMGMGYWMTEKFTYDPDSGQLLTHNTWVRSVPHLLVCDSTSTLLQEYKPPSSQDIPIDWRVELLKNAPNPIGILRSKGGLL